MSDSGSDISSVNDDWEDEEIVEHWSDSIDDDVIDNFANNVYNAPLPSTKPELLLPDNEYIQSHKDLYTSLLANKELKFQSISIENQIELMKTLSVQSFQPGEMVFNEGELSCDLYFVVSSDEDAESSEVEVVRAEDAGERALTRLLRGQVFGHKFFVTKILRRRNASIRVPKDCPHAVQVAKLTQDFFSNWEVFRKTLLVQPIPLFQTLPPDEYEFLTENIVVREFEPNQYIVREGEIGSEFFIIREGCADVVKEIGVPPPGNHIVTLREGHFFGEMSLINEDPCVASVIALQPTVCLCLSKSTFQAALSAKHFYEVLHNVLSQRQERREKKAKMDTSMNSQTNPQFQESIATDYECMDMGRTDSTGSSGLTPCSPSASFRQSAMSSLSSNNRSFSLADHRTRMRLPSINMGSESALPSAEDTGDATPITNRAGRSISIGNIVRNSSINSTTNDSVLSGSSSTSFHSQGSAGGDAGYNILADDLPHEHDVITTSTVTVKKLASGTKVVNKYVILRELGRGSFGDVFLCRDEESGLEYAMKVVHRPIGLHGASQLADSIRREIAMFKKLRHRNIVRLHEVIDDPSSKMVFIIQEFLEGGPLLPNAMVVDRIEPNIARKYFRDIICGLHYLHANGIIHRDIKPQNLLLSKDGIVKLADFGSSVRDMSFMNVCNAGTPAYMSPEICTNHPSIEVEFLPAIDIFAAGATLYCMVLGRPPWSGNNIFDLASKIKNIELTFPTENIDPHLKYLLQRLLEKDYKKRITLDEIMVDDWVTDEGADPIVLPCELDIDYQMHCMSLGLSYSRNSFLSPGKAAFVSSPLAHASQAGLSHSIISSATSDLSSITSTILDEDIVPATADAVNGGGVAVATAAGRDDYKPAKRRNPSKGLSISTTLDCTTPVPASPSAGFVPYSRYKSKTILLIGAGTFHLTGRLISLGARCTVVPSLEAALEAIKAADLASSFDIIMYDDSLCALGAGLSDFTRNIRSLGYIGYLIRICRYDTYTSVDEASVGADLTHSGASSATSTLSEAVTDASSSVDVGASLPQGMSSSKLSALLSLPAPSMAPTSHTVEAMLEEAERVHKDDLTAAIMTYQI